MVGVRIFGGGHIFDVWACVCTYISFQMTMILEMSWTPA